MSPPALIKQQETDVDLKDTRPRHNWPFNFGSCPVGSCAKPVVAGRPGVHNGKQRGTRNKRGRELAVEWREV